MPYSAVTQPRPVLRRKGGTFSSTEAVHSTWVSPNRDEAGALGIFGEAGLEANGAQLVGGAAGGARHGGSRSFVNGGRAKLVRGPAAVQPSAAGRAWLG